MLIRSNCALVFASLLVCISSAKAANIVVSKCGMDSPTCGFTGTNPCLTIFHAISIAAANDRVLVHPGTYVEEALVIAIDGLELTSLSGRSVTRIIPSDPFYNGILINSSNVRVGEKANGFSIESGYVGIYVDSFASNVKIEGNRLADNEYSGIHFNGDEAQIRFNVAENNGAHGFSCFDCVNALVRSNSALNNGSNGFDLQTDDAAVNQNISMNNGGIGLDIRPLSGGASDLSTVTANSNVLEGNTGDGLVVETYYVNVRGNIASENQGSGMVLRGEASYDSNSDVKHNLSVENAGAGIDTVGYNVGFFNIEHNTAIGNSLGISNYSSSPLFSDNTTYNNGVGIEHVDTELYPLYVVSHFLGSDTLAGDISGTFASKPNLTKVGIAKGLGF